MIEVGPDGVVWVAGPSGVASWDGLDWMTWSAPMGQRPLAILPAPDGAALVPWFSEGGGPAEGYADARMGVDRLTGHGARDPGEPLTLDVPLGDVKLSEFANGELYVISQTDGVFRIDPT